jgi:hypothetical protein
MFEHRLKPLLPFGRFVRRMARSAGVAVGIVLGALFIGTLGYHHLEGLPWIDAELNAAMILSGMGPVDPMKAPAAKIFASVYALCSGFLFLTVAALLFAPLLHRMMHRFHLEAGESDAEKDEEQEKKENGRESDEKRGGKKRSARR